MPNDNVLTDERVAAAKNIVAAWVQSRKTFIDGEAYGAAVELVAFALARNPGQPEPRAEVTPLKVERHSDMSVLVVFSSCRQASVFEKEIAARAGGQ